MSDVLVDSSVWIDFFRGEKQAFARLDPLLADDRAAVCGPVLAEVASGAKTLSVFRKLMRRLSALTVLEAPSDLWARVAEARFALARQGVQAHLVDLSIACTASAHDHAILTRDGDFERLARIVTVEVVVF